MTHGTNTRDIPSIDDDLPWDTHTDDTTPPTGNCAAMAPAHDHPIDPVPLIEGPHVSIHVAGVADKLGMGGYVGIMRRMDGLEEIRRHLVEGRRLEDATQAQMTMKAALKALSVIKAGEPQPVIVQSSLKHFIDGMNGGALRWKAQRWRNGEGKPTPHADLWEALLTACDGKNVEWRHVGGSSGDEVLTQCLGEARKQMERARGEACAA